MKIQYKKKKLRKFVYYYSLTGFVFVFSNFPFLSRAAVKINKMISEVTE